MARSLVVFDTPVRTVSPVGAAVLCTLTLGITGIVRHGKLNVELRRLGAVRGTMPFPFIQCAPGAAITAWVFGLLGWMVAFASLVALGIDIARGVSELEAELVSTVTAVSLLATPLWLTALHTGRRLRTAQHLVGLPSGFVRPYGAAIATVIFPPAGIFYVQRAANRAWTTWAQPQSQPAPQVQPEATA